MLKALFLVVLLSGCVSTPPAIEYEKPQFHPTFPEPYSVCPIKWEVLEVDGRAKIALSYNDNITAAICAKDKDRYIQQLINLTCYYRKDNSERICSKEQNDSKSTKDI